MTDIPVASIAARAKLYDNMLERMSPADINEIPTEIFNQLALECEPEPVMLTCRIVPHCRDGNCDVCVHIREALHSEANRTGRSAESIYGRF